MPANLTFLSNAIHLVAICEGKPTEALWFGDNRDTAQAWADGLNDPSQRYNIYFSVNVVRAGLNKKASKADITDVRALHCDIDGTDNAAAALHWRPSVLINSGGGFNLLWWLQQATTIDAAEDVNRRIAHALGADHCWNIDRILRVPGTINWPTVAKTARGRVPAWSTLEHSDPNARYALDGMAAAFPPVPVEARQAAGEADVGEWVPLRLADVPMPPQLRAMCEHEAAKGERSEHVAKCCAALGYAGLSNAEVMGLLMHPDNSGLHGHIADQHNPERAARRKVAVTEASRPDAERIFGSVPAVLPPGARTETVMATEARESGIEGRNGGIMLPDQQVIHFRGLVYVISEDKILMTNGVLLNQSRFDAKMGGWAFVLDQGGEKTTNSAWEAFLRNQRYAAPTVDALCFQPENPPHSIVADGNLRMVNTYVPIITPTIQGDVSPWLNLMKLQLPDERDRRILLTYMASCIQNPGMKSQWWIILQGAPGGGKSTYILIMEYCIGKQYCHLPNAAKMVRNGINFTGWIRGKMFLGLEEIYSANRRDFLEEFKPFITNRRLPIESKGVEEYTGDNRANGILCTNHKDGVPLDENERRYAPFFLKHQSRADLERDGLNDPYWRKFWDWMKDEGGYAKINAYLRAYECEAEFDPNQLATRAPTTSSLAEAISCGHGRAEQEIMEAIESQQIGFSGGWISSAFVDRLLKAERISVPKNKRREMLERLGYYPHPQLTDGRVSTKTAPENARSVLYVKRDHMTCLNQMTPAMVAQAYTRAQDECITAEHVAKFRGS